MLFVHVAGGRAAAPTFFPDDPIAIDPDAAVDASGVQEIPDSNYYDFIDNTFGTPGETADIRAKNVNTVDEVPDSSWFTNRIGTHPLSVAEVVKGPDRLEGVSASGWTVVRDKGTGLQPGWRMQDPSGQLYQVEFDPPSNPEMASGAEIIGTAFYHAFGYHVAEVYPVDIDPARLGIAPDATIRDRNTNRRRRLVRADIDEVLGLAARLPNGHYRALASRFVEGRQVGSFRYFGTRPDDPNDVIPHEHRRELRGNRVFAAWLNHDDSRGINSLDMLVGPEGRKYIKHYMFDFGSIMGSGTVFPQTPRAGNEYILEWGPAFKTLASLGLYVRPWLRVNYPDVPESVGNFEAEFFDPIKWRPEYPNAAFRNMRPDDAFWAARIVARFSDAMIRGIVEKAKYSDASATEYMTATLIKRRDKVLKAWLNNVNPVVDVRLSDAGTLSFDNAAVAAGVATAPERYTLTWSRFDNAAGTLQPVDGGGGMDAPPGLLEAGEYVSVAIRAVHAEHPAWAQPVQVYFRREGSGWKTVGLERLRPATPRAP